MRGRLERLARDERADARLDQPRLLARDDAEARELVVPAAGDALIAPPRQHRLDMPGAETLPGAIDRAEQLLREHGRIDLRGGLEAIVAIAAAFERILAKVPQQQRAATLDRFDQPPQRSEEHTSELQSLMRISYAVFCLKKKKNNKRKQTNERIHHEKTNTIQST